MARGNTVRMSNLELLRIVAMFLVMLGHSHLRVHPFPQAETICQYPIRSFGNVLVACVTTTGVDIFIAISGWFGIRFKLEGLVRYLFQVLFILWVVYTIAIGAQLTGLSVEGVKVSLGFYDSYWYVTGYLGLYLFSPLLNKFVDYASKREYQSFLLLFYFFQCYFSWLTAWYDYYMGYSVLLFAGIYLTAAYFRKYPVRWLERNALALLAVAVLVMAAIATSSLLCLGHAARQIRDDNPLVIFVSILLLLSFRKMKFQNRLVNWLAASCFAVYLIHVSPFVYPYFISVVSSIYQQFDGLSYAFILLLSFSIVYLSCVLFDQIRLVAWTYLLRLYRSFL